MNYPSNLQCKTEPFASHSGAEILVYQGLRDSIEKISRHILLGSGLQLVIGAAGSGKTTLLNQLSQKFCADNRTVVLLLNNPQFNNLHQFLITVAGVFKTIKAPAGFDDDIFQKAFNSFFYKLCQQEKKTVLLLIDNGQNLPDFCLQALVSFYDYHPDCRRFLQTVICGEASFQRKINRDSALKNLVAFTTVPEPFRFADTRKFIRLQLKRDAAHPGSPPVLFNLPAQWIIYSLTQGHPQKTIDLCRLIVLTLVIENRKKAGWFMILRCGKLLIPVRAGKLQVIRITALSSLIIFMLAYGILSGQITALNVSKQEHLPQGTLAQKAQSPKTEPAIPVKITQKTTTQVPARKTLPTDPPVIKKSPLLIIPAEEQISGAVQAENSPAFTDKPDDKTLIAEIPGPESGETTGREVAPGLKPVSELANTPAIRERLVMKPGDTFLGMMQQVYGSDYMKTNYIDQVIAANPHLKDPRNPEVGDQVFFPVFVGEKEKPPSTASVLESKSDRELAPEKTQVDPPEYLGDIITAPGENFSDMIRRIYGPWSFNPLNVRTVIAANPGLNNPELLNVGDKIHFPAIPVALTPEAEEVWWVRISTMDSIQSAYRFLRKYRKSPPPLIIIPSRDNSGQIFMNILQEDYFTDKESAQKAILALPASISGQAEPLYGLDPATFYYRRKTDLDNNETRKR